MAFSLVRAPSLPAFERVFEKAPISAGLLPITWQDVTDKLNFGHARIPSGEHAKGVKRYAFYNNWDENAFLSLRSNIQHLDGILPEWLHLDGAHGGIRLDNARKQSTARLWLQKNSKEFEIIPVLNNYNVQTGLWEGETVTQLLASDMAVETLIGNIVNEIELRRYQGIAIDFKRIGDESVAQFLAFVKKLKQRLESIDKSLFVTLPAYERRFDVWTLADSADRLILLAYDQHWEQSAAGPLSAQGWFEAQLEHAFKRVDGSKFIVALGSYAMDWSHSSTPTARRISVSDAWEILGDSDAQFWFEGQSLNGMFSYVSPGNVSHSVWMLDGVTMHNQTASALAMEPFGLALWRLGTEEPTVWASFGKGRVPTSASANEIRMLPPNDAISYSGDGEVLTVVDRNSPGSRSIDYKAQHNLITSQRVQELPKSLTITRWGHNRDKLLALTFDDGPSSSYTPRILEILRDKGVKATFFVVGANAALESSILRDIYNDGHDIGNHTFTHPNLSSIGTTQLDLELNATQRVLEAKLGIGTRLFRPPFNKDAEPSTRDEARTLISAAALGYISIGLQIDPLDWERPGTKTIVERTVEYAEMQSGNIILLHDAGGDRGQTVEALPEIIDRLSEKGYRFVALHELLGMSRDEVMPRLNDATPYVTGINSVGLSAASTLNWAFSALFYVAIVLGVMRLAVIVVAACIQSRSAQRRKCLDWQPASIAIIVPAYNEADVITDCIASLLECVGNVSEIIVVDDGSTDDTYGVALNAYRQHPRVKVYRKPNGGKATALNFGIEIAKSDIIVAIDADTRLDSRAVSLLSRHFVDPKLGAVAGAVEVGNAKKLITRFQALEYVVSQNLDRRALEVANGIIVVPGAIGAWRRDAVLDVGGYEEDTLAEDADLTLKLQRAGWHILYEPAALARTEAPQTLGLFLRQRFRWMFGMLQVAFKHIGALRERGAHGVKYFALPNILLFQFLFALVSPIVDLLLLLSIGADVYHYIQNGMAAASPRTLAILSYWAIWHILEFAVAVVAYKLDGRRMPIALFPMLALQRFCYRQLIYYVAIKSVAAAIHGRLVGWDKLPRQGLGGESVERSVPHRLQLKKSP
ncbi:polysaccharide deacetylase [Hyphomicrobium nitrativorans NL23]|uniref:Chitooligosaccharide deacetylase n=1 Tax=Hyphomicrobium nitrativorans NL23 TaxID=1029756 RepID=V5SAQ0_9HYPH|nr:glycosyltransferase [Hyphomicrobium nitrativorans]AHB47831.1 polysaccharide deacetylase [Hyphomicrobium nitrativorans NL23]